MRERVKVSLKNQMIWLFVSIFNYRYIIPPEDKLMFGHLHLCSRRRNCSLWAIITLFVSTFSTFSVAEDFWKTCGKRRNCPLYYSSSSNWYMWDSSAWVQDSQKAHIVKKTDHHNITGKLCHLIVWCFTRVSVISRLFLGILLQVLPDTSKSEVMLTP